jgi:outer membrane protein OmpA-like peptidoglycan-associated protein
LFFAFGQAELTPAAASVLEEVAERLRTQAVGVVSVVGHTDAVGDDASNLILSQRRAGTVVTDLDARLTGSGLTLSASGKGETEPVAPNALPDGKDSPDGR